MKEQKRKTFNFIFFYWGISLLMGISVCYFLFSEQEKESLPVQILLKPCTFPIPPKIDIQPIVEDETVKFEIFEPIVEENKIQDIDMKSPICVLYIHGPETNTISPGEPPIPKTPNEYFLHFDEMMEEAEGEEIPYITKSKEPEGLPGPFINPEIEPEPINLEEIRELIGYPQTAKDHGIEGNVVVRMLVDKNGNYKKHRIINAVNPILSQAVEKHITKLRFTPARQGRKTISFWVNIPFRFSKKN